MLTQQEALEAMAGRSAEGKPLVFVSQQDYAALSKKYEELARAVKKQHTYSWALVALVVVLGAAVIAIRFRSVSASVEPFGPGYYTSNNVAGVHAANAFCGSRKEQREMKLVDALGNSGLLFNCVMSAEELAAAQLQVPK